MYIETATDDLIVLNPRWLCADVLGKLLGGPGDLPSDGHLSRAHLTGLFPDVDVADSATLLTALELCTVVAPGSWYQLSCRNSLPVPDDDDRASDCRPCAAGGIALVADSTARLRCVFPRLQHAVWNAPRVERATEWSGGIRFRRRASESGPDSVVTVRIDAEEGEDVVRIVCRGHDARALYRLQQATAATVLRASDACCPGVYLHLRALSPRDIRAADRPLPRAYAARELAAAELDGREEVRLDGEEEGESLRDVLAFGDAELYAALRPGVELHVSRLPIFTRCRLGALLDPPHPHGRDWRLLALALGLADSVPLLDGAETAALCRTDHLLALWSHERGATVGRLVDVVRRTLQRPDVEETLLRLTPLCESPAVDAEKSVSPSLGVNHALPASCNHSQHISRTPSSVTA